MLEGLGLSCVRDGRTLFKNLDLLLEPGTALQIEGVNGAGKTSLMRILCGLAQPRLGEVHWSGENIHRCRTEFHRHLLYIGHNPGIKHELTALENLHFFRSLGGHANDAVSLEEALDHVGLYGYEDVLVRSLSAGQRRRVALARLWLSTTSLWILDEPFTAIDRQGIRNLEARIADHLGAGGMAVLTTHQALDLGDSQLRRLQLS
jgi:heme exporter protein A